MSILLVSSLNFKHSGATQTRQKLIIEALQFADFNIELLNLQFECPPQKDVAITTISEKLRFFPWRIAALIGGLPRLHSGIRRNHVCLCFGIDPQLLLPSIIFAKILRRPIFHEFTEFPSIVKSPNLYGTISVWLFERFFLRQFTGVSVISHALKEYVLTWAPNANVIIIPAIARTIAEHSAFSTENQCKRNGNVSLISNTFKFLYAGSLVEHKDGVLSLVEAFSMVSNKYTSARLEMYGYGTNVEKRAVKNKITQLGLSAVAILNDPIPSADLPALLANADALVLCRPQSYQALGGFPTKLAEYLATGRPVICTITSDIGDYLEDGVSAYLTKPDDVIAFADAMKRAMTNPGSANTIGSNGRIVFNNYFEYRAACKPLVDWLSRMARRKQ